MSNYEAFYMPHSYPSDFKYKEVYAIWYVSTHIAVFTFELHAIFPLHRRISVIHAGKARSHPERKENYRDIVTKSYHTVTMK